MNRKLILVWVCLAVLLGGTANGLNAADPPDSPVKLIFIHHSCGENWLADDNGGLGIALRDNNYFVSDTNYGWGPDSIGSTTDIGHWYNWFLGPNRDSYLNALYDESGQNAWYSRLATDPGGENRIIMFKSCFPNSQLGGDPNAAPNAGPDNPLRGQDAYSGHMTVANAKGIYLDLLDYFATQPDKLFIAVTAPPLVADATDPAHAANARAFNNWLVNHWLDGYSHQNVGVFDFYDVLAGPDNMAAYPTGDSHPNATGNQLATDAFIPVLNGLYRSWPGAGSSQDGDDGDDGDDGGGDGLNRLYYPHVASDNNWETEITLINHGDQDFAGTLKPYNDAGQSVSMDVPVSAPPHGRVELAVSNQFISPDTVKYLVLETETPLSELSGYLKFYQYSMNRRVAVPAVSDINAGEIYLPHIASDSHWWTGLSLVNTTATAKELLFTFNNGTTASQTLAPYAHDAFMIKSLFGGQTPAGIESAIITHGEGVIGLELFGSLETSPNRYLSGVLLKDQLAQSLYYPHIASDFDWWTGVVAYNPHASACNLTLTPYAADGTALAAQTQPIDPYGKYIGVVSDLNLPPETAWFQVDASTFITGFELFGRHNGFQLAGYTGVNITAKSGVFAKIESDGWTGIAFVNIDAEPASITLTAYDNGGNPVATGTRTLNRHEKALGMAESFFEADIGTANYIRYVSDNNLVGFQLNGSANGMMLDGLPGMAVETGQ